MLKEPQTGDAAPWKQRFRAPTIVWTQLAKRARDRGLACGNKSGVYQLYAWDVPTGELRQVTHRKAGVVSGTLSPDGRYIYYMDDKQGNEIGHYVRVPFAGGQPEDISPQMPLYASWSLAVNMEGNLLGFTTADDKGFHTYAMERGENNSMGE